MVVGGGAMGASAAFHLARARDHRRRPARARHARGRLDEQVGRRDPRAVRRRAEHPDRAALDRRVRPLRGADRHADRLRAVRLPLPARLRGRPRAVPGGARSCRRRLGVPSGELTVDDALAIVPQLDPDGLVGATWCPTDGRATPEATVAGYADAARRAGVRVRQGEPVERIDVRDGRIEAVVTPKGRIATDTVVCTAGVWTRDVGALAGLDDPGRGPAPAHVVHAGTRRPAEPAPAHDRLHDQLLLPRRGSRRRVRRPGGVSRGRGRAHRAPAAGARRAADPVARGGATTR